MLPCSSALVAITFCVVLAQTGAARPPPSMMVMMDLDVAPSPLAIRGLWSPLRALSSRVVRGLTRWFAASDGRFGVGLGGINSAALAPAPIPGDHRLSNTLGYLAVVFGILPSFPQYIKNFREKRGDAISMDSFLYRFVACVMNFAGSLLTPMPLFNRIMSFYFCIDSVAIVLQSLYYNRGKAVNPASKVTRFSIAIATFLTLTPIVILCTGLGLSVPINKTLLGVGSFSLWSSNVVFVWSRFPQIYMAWNTKSVCGVSVVMYILLIIDNLLAGAGLLAQNLADHVPMSVLLYGSSAAVFFGTFGPVFFDLLYLWMFWHYRGREPALIPDFGDYAPLPVHPVLIESGDVSENVSNGETGKIIN